MAFALRAHHLGSQSLWSDEDITVDRAEMSTGEMLARLPPEHTPLYFVTERAWTLGAGTADYPLRFPSALAGVLAVAAAAAAGRGLAGRGAGAVLALLMAVNPFLVWYGQDARMYALLAALGLLALAAALVARRRGGGWWVATGALAAATVYTHYYGALTVFVLGTWAVADIGAAQRQRRSSVDVHVGASSVKRVARGWIVAGVVGALLFLPWLGRVRSLLEYQGWRDPVPLAAIPGIDLRAWTGGPTAAASWVAFALAAYLALAAVGVAVLLARCVRDRGDGGALPPVKALLYLLVPVVVAAFAAFRQPDFHPRYFTAVVPALYLAAAVGSTAWPRAPLRAVAVAALVLPAAPALARLYGDPAVQKQDYGGFVHAVERAAGWEDTVLFLDGPIYGLTRRYEMDDSPVKIVNLQSSGNEERSPDERTARIAELAADYPHLWLATNGAAQDLARPWLLDHAYPVGREAYQTITLERFYAPNPDPNEPDRPAAAPSCPAGAPACLEARVPATVATGGLAPILLLWRPTTRLPGGLKESVRLVAHQAAAGPGSPAAETDLAAVDAYLGGTPDAATDWPVGADHVERQALVVPPGATGTPRLKVVLYEAGGERELASWDGPQIRITP